MFSHKRRSLFPISGVLCLLGALFLILGRNASAQTIAGYAIGENRSRLGTITWQDSYGGYVSGSFDGDNGVRVSGTYEQSTGKLVRLDASSNGLGLHQPAYFSDFRFGQTTLAVIRQRFGNMGMLTGSGSPVLTTPDGGIAISSFYEVAGSDVVAAFITKIGRPELVDLQRRFGADAYAQMATIATLESIAISDADYFRSLRGTTSVVDVGYHPIAWEKMSFPIPEPKRQISLARIKPSQLPVARVYSGPVNPPDLGGQNATFRNYHARITDGMAGGPTFAGEFAVIQIDCGTRCSSAFIGNVRTGEVFKMPIGGRSNLDLTLKYELSSRLMTSQWSDRNTGKCVVQFFSFDDGEWIELLKQNVGETRGCVTSLSQNLR